MLSSKSRVLLEDPVDMKSSANVTPNPEPEAPPKVGPGRPNVGTPGRTNPELEPPPKLERRLGGKPGEAPTEVPRSENESLFGGGGGDGGGSTAGLGTESVLGGGVGGCGPGLAEAGGGGPGSGLSWGSARFTASSKIQLASSR